MMAYRADFYLFRHFLTGLGSFRDPKVRSHTATKLVFGINRVFKISLEKSWHTARVALIDGGTPHALNGEGDWQLVLWMDRDTNLADILRRRRLKGRPWTLQEVDQLPAFEEIAQSAVDGPDRRGALGLAESLLQVYAGVKPVPATWDAEVRKVVDLIDKAPGETQASSLARKLGREETTLDADFRRVMGLRFNEYLHRRKWITYIGHRQSGIDCDTALGLAGLPGWEAVRERFDERYGLDLEVLEQNLPFVRAYDGGDEDTVMFL